MLKSATRTVKRRIHTIALSIKKWDVISFDFHGEGATVCQSISRFLILQLHQDSYYFIKCDEFL